MLRITKIDLLVVLGISGATLAAAALAGWTNLLTALIVVPVLVSVAVTTAFASDRLMRSIVAERGRETVVSRWPVLRRTFAWLYGPRNQPSRRPKERP